jgi:glucan 1,3-beta-glucosidase
MKVSALVSLFSILGAVSAQYERPAVVEAAIQRALKSFPPWEAYDGPTKAAPAYHPVATPKFRAADAGGYWLEQIAHQGISAFGPSGYKVWRNVKDFGAKGQADTASSPGNMLI